MKTIKQMADEWAIDKQRVYRYIRKNRVNEVLYDAGVMWYDEAAESLIKQGIFAKNRISEVLHDVHQSASSDAVIDTVFLVLKAELDVKNELILAQQRTINDLTIALEHTTDSLRAAQALHAGTIQERLTDDNTAAVHLEPPMLPNFFVRLFGRKKR